jgi:tetratricopeptide (TPR) repeat protein
VWTPNAGGYAYNDVDRYEEALDWLTPALRLELDRNDAERIVDQLSDARRRALEALGGELDALEDEVDAFRRRTAEREEQQVAEMYVIAATRSVALRTRGVRSAP